MTIPLCFWLTIWFSTSNKGTNAKNSVHEKECDIQGKLSNKPELTERSKNFLLTIGEFDLKIIYNCRKCFPFPCPVKNEFYLSCSQSGPTGLIDQNLLPISIF